MTDACALAMILWWPDAELLGVTTNLDSGGRRARCVAYVLQRADRDDVPVAAGAAASLTTLARYESTWSDRRYLPDTIDPLPSPPGRGPHLLADNIAAGATLVAIGTHTNLGLLAVTLPGILDGVPVVAMGGWSIRPRGTVTVTVGTEIDWSVQRWWRPTRHMPNHDRRLTVPRRTSRSRGQATVGGGRQVHGSRAKGRPTSRLVRCLSS